MRWQTSPSFLGPAAARNILVQLRVILSRFDLFRYHTAMIVLVRRTSVTIYRPVHEQYECEQKW